MLPKDFYKKVEEPGFLKHILYGDSVHEYSEVSFIKKNKIFHEIPIKNIWNDVLENNSIIYDNNKEYIYDPNIEIKTYDYNIDRVIFKRPKYICRHFINDTLIKLNTSIASSITVTSNHSLINLDDNGKIINISPSKARYVATEKGLVSFNKFDFLYFLFGLWVGDGTFSNKYYPSISSINRNPLIEYLMSYDPSLKPYPHKNGYDFSINYPALNNIIIENNLKGVHSVDRILNKSLIDKFQNDNIFFSFLAGYWLSDGSITNKKVTLNSGSLSLINDLRKILISKGMYTHITIDKNGRTYKGKTKGDMYKAVICGISDSFLQVLKIISIFKNCKTDVSYTYFGKGTSKENKNITRRKDMKLSESLIALRITSKSDILYSGYVYDICVPETQNFFANGICVHNTDSLFVKIPYKGAENKTAEERWKITQKGASLINGSIIKYYNEWLLPRSNISIEHNKTDFKPELTILIILFLSVKKNYAYLYDVKEGEIYNTPKLKKTSNLGIKSDMSIMTRNLLDDLLAKISLNTNITNKYEACVNIYKSYREKYIELINQYDFGDISIPGKWGKKALMFNGMKLYNFMVGKDVFSFGSAGKFVYCIFKNKSLLDNSGVLQKDMNGLCFPYAYDKDLLRRKMVDYGITIDIETQWNKIFTTTCERVFEILKNY